MTKILKNKRKEMKMKLKKRSGVIIKERRIERREVKQREKNRRKE